MQHFDLKALGVRLRGIESCRQLFSPVFGSRSNELFLIALVNAHCELIQLLMFEGDREQVEVGVSRVFQEALIANAEAIILAHNHPSGQVQPSRSDKLLTKSMLIAAEALDLALLDHLIFSETGVFSFRQRGLL